MGGEDDDPNAATPPAKEGEEQADSDSAGPDDAEPIQVTVTETARSLSSAAEVKVMESARSSPPAAEAADRLDPMLPTKSTGSRVGSRRTVRASTVMPSSAADDDPTSPSMLSGLLSPSRGPSKAASERQPEVRFALSDSRTGTKSPARAMSKAQSEGGERQPASAPRMSRVSSLASRTSTMRSDKDLMSVSSSSSIPAGHRASTLTLSTPGGGRRATRLRSMPADLEKELAKPKKAPEEEALSSKEDVWDLLLLNENGQRLRDIRVEDFAEQWQQLKDMGLDLKLAEVLRDMSPKAAESPGKEKPKLVGKDLSGEHMRQLAMMLIRDQSIEGPLDDDEEKEEFLMQLQMAVDTGKEVDGDMRISYKNFKKLMTLGAWILCIDETYVYMQLVWARVGRFEMTLELFQAVTAIAKWSKGEYEFKRNQLDIMMHSNGILIRTQKAGLVWGNFHGQFDRFLLQKQDLLRRRQEQKNDERTQDRRENFAKGTRPPDAVCGRTEFSMWLESLFAFTKQADRKVYKSPLQMCADWIRCARKLEDFSDTEDENDNDDDSPRSPNKASQSDKIILDAKRQEEESAQLKDQFKKLDVNCKGSLTFEQFCTFLLQGSPHLTEKELRGLFKLADTNKDGIVIFKEFVDFIHSSNDDMYEEAPMPAPEGVKSVFRDYCSYQSEQMDMFHFTKMLRDSSLIDKDLTLAEVELIFNQIRSTKSKTLTLGGVERALKHCADKKGVEQGDIYEALWHLRRVADEPPPGSATPGGRTNSKAKAGASLIQASLTWLSANRKGSKTPAESTSASPQPSGRLRASHVAPTINTPVASPRPADKMKQTLPALSAAKSTPNLKQATR